MQPTGSPPYPATFSVDTPERVANWRPLVHWFLAIPHLVVLYVLQIVAGVLAVVSWFAILITGRMPEGLANYQAMYLRYWARAATYAAFLHETYPPFTFATTPGDPGDLPPVRLEVQPALADRNRLTTFFRFLLLIPHAIVLWILGIAAWVVVLIGAVVVLFTGRWPDGLRTFLVGYGRWATRAYSYGLLLTDEYPPFSLD